MLQKLNERIQGVIAWVVIGLIALTFTLFGVEHYMQSRGASDTEVSVNGEAITKESFEKNYRRARQQYESGQLSSNLEKTIKDQLMNDMIVNLVSLEAAKKAGYVISNAQADSVILSIPQFQEKGTFSPQRYQQMLNGAFFTPDSFRTEVKQGMLVNQQRFAMMGSAFVLPAELERFVKLYRQTRDYDYLIVPAKSFLNASTASEEQIATYYQQHQKEFLAPEKVSIDYILVSVDGIKKQLAVDEQTIDKYYEENPSNIEQLSKTKLPAEVREQIKDQLLSEMAQKQFVASVEQLADLSYQSPDSLNLAAENLKLPVQHSELFSRNGGQEPVSKNKQIIHAAFSHDVLTGGNNSEPIQLSDNEVVVLRINKHQSPAAMPLQEVKEKIRNQLAMVDAASKAKTFGLELLAQKEETAVQTLLNKMALSWSNQKNASRNNDKIDAFVNALAFALSKIDSEEGKPLRNGDFLIVKLKKINNGDIALLNKEELTHITQQIEANYGQTDYDLYINQLVKRAKIERG